MKDSDVDLMFVMKDISVYENINDINFNPTETCLAMQTDDTKPGFTQLLLVHTNMIHFIQMCTMVGSSYFLSNELLKSQFGNGFDVIHGPCLSDKKGTYDLACCLHCRSWISPAKEWIKRANKWWPSSEVKSTIIDHGVLFVPIGAKGSPNEAIEWRISFSVGEKLLIYTFDHTQLLCYVLLKILLKILISADRRCKDLLCSFYLKTIMFWISEELPLSEWTSENLIPCFLRCFRRLIYCVEYTVCPHYFIPEINLFENKIEGHERERLLEKLYTLYNYGWRCVLLSEELSQFKLPNNIVTNVAEPFSEYIGQVFRSCVLMTFPDEINRKISVKMILSHRSLMIKLFYLYFLSISCDDEAQNISMTQTFRNKDMYKQYRTCLCYLLQNLHHDAVSGWLMLASFFCQMKLYLRALDILSYSLSKCTHEKVLCTHKKMSHEQYPVGLMHVVKTLCLKQVIFREHSSLIPKELELEVADKCHFIPAVVCAHFLCFLCYYYLNDVWQYRESLKDLQLTIEEEYFIPDHTSKATAYNCLGIALQLIGDHESTRKAFVEAMQLDTEMNCATQRLLMMKTKYSSSLFTMRSSSTLSIHA